MENMEVLFSQISEAYLRQISDMETDIIVQKDYSVRQHSRVWFIVSFSFLQNVCIAFQQTQSPKNEKHLSVTFTYKEIKKKSTVSTIELSLCISNNLRDGSTDMLQQCCQLWSGMSSIFGCSVFIWLPLVYTETVWNY